MIILGQRKFNKINKIFWKKNLVWGLLKVWFDFIAVGTWTWAEFSSSSIICC